MKKKLLATLLVTLVALGATACSSDDTTTTDGTEVSTMDETNESDVATMDETEATEEDLNSRAIESDDTEGVVLDDTVPPVGEATGGHDPNGENDPVERPMASSEEDTAVPSGNPE